MTKEENGHLAGIKLEVKELRKDMESVKRILNLEEKSPLLSRLEANALMLKFVLGFMGLILALVGILVFRI